MDDDTIRKRSLSNNSIKYIWERLRTELYKCICQYGITDPVNEETFK